MNTSKTARVAVLCGGLALCGGCMSYMGSLAEDHTVGLVSRPLTAPAELIWRVKTLGGEAAGRLNVKYRKFPRLDRSLPPPLDPARQPMPDSLLGDWLERKVGCCVPADLEVLVGGDAFFPRFEQVVAAATNRVFVQVYIFDNDDVAFECADLLRERSDRLDVRVLVDGIGSRRAWAVQSPSACVPGPRAGGNIVRYLRQGSRVRVRRWPNLWLSSNHQKILVVDGQTAFLGGMNIGHEYRYDWRDAMVQAGGPLAAELELRFLRAWKGTRFLADLTTLGAWRRTHRALDSEGRACCYLVRTTPFRHQIYEARLRAAALARDRIYVENPYLWNDSMLYALCEARKRGVDVRVTVALDVNVPSGERANRVALNTLLHHGVRVFLYPGMTHVKAAIYDGWAEMGSANFDDLSLHKNTELDLFTADPAFRRAVEEDLLLRGQDLSTEITEPQPLSVWDALAERLADFL